MVGKDEVKISILPACFESQVSTHQHKEESISTVYKGKRECESSKEKEKYC